MSKNLSRILVALLLLSTLTAGAAQAAPRSADAEMSPLASLWEWVASWFEISMADEGCGMDPDGRCRNGSTTDEGSHMDPNG